MKKIILAACAALLPLAAHAQTWRSDYVFHQGGKTISILMVHRDAPHRIRVTAEMADHSGKPPMILISEVQCDTGRYRVASMAGDGFHIYPYGTAWKLSVPGSPAEEVNGVACEVAR